MTKVFVTGIGIISAIGKDLNENRNSLIKGESGLKRSVYLDSNYKDQFYFGEVNFSDEDLHKSLGLNPKSGFCRTDLLAFKAFNEAIADAGLTPANLSTMDTGIISASTVGGMSETNELYLDSQAGTETSKFIHSYAGNSHLIHLIKAHKVKGLSDCINTACSSSANAIMTGAKWIKSGRANRVIVGGTDALSKFTVNGFNSLQILSSEKCRPFDVNRSGLNLGEGAAYLVLESEEIVKDKKIYAEVVGYGNSNDAFHPSSLSEDATGVIKAMKEALTTANCPANQIDYINAHGTATQNNDSTEILGISELIGKNVPYSSTKSYTGHTLGAAGAIEAVYAILCMQHGELYGSLNFSEVIPGFNPPVLNYRQNVEVKHVLSNSFGFAGNCTSILLAKKEAHVH